MDEVVAQVERRKVRAALEAGDVLDAILLEIDAAQVGELVEALDSGEAVALEP